MSKFIPIYEYVKNNNTSRQNVYRWIREGKFEESDVIKEEVTVVRTKIKEDAKPKLANN